MPLKNDDMTFEDCPPARNSLMSNHAEDVEALIIAVNERRSSRMTTESNLITESEEVYSTDEEEDFALAGVCFSKGNSKG